MIDNRFFNEINGNFGFGCMRLPMKENEVDQQEMCRMVDAFLEQGFNYFDTAHGYVGGKSETALRECLTSRYPRDAYILANKLSTHFFTREDQLEELFESQLEACGVDYFDFYLMHAQESRIFEKFKQCGAYEFAFRKKEEGKVKHVGISFHDKADVLETILQEYPQIEIVQIQLNYIDYEDPSVESRKVYEVCEKYHKPVIVMEPVKGGTLVDLPGQAQDVLDELQKDSKTPMSNASYAIRFAASFPNICMVLSGMGNQAQMLDNTSYMKEFKPLDEKELKAIEQIRDVFDHLSMIQCTSCHYCVLDNDCPMKIRIPELFSCFNQKMTFHNWNQDYYYNNILIKDAGKASDCIHCGKCEAICPQHLPIRNLLEEVAREFEK